MLILKSNFFSILFASSMFLMSCAEVNNEVNNLDYPSELSGYEYQEKGLLIFVKNYTEDKIKVTVDSNEPTSISNNKNSNISELFFESKLKDNLSVRIEDPSGMKSILMRNPDIAYDKKPYKQTFDIRYNQTVFIKEIKTTLTLLNVSEDSRCPDPTDNKGAEGFSTSREAGSCLHIPKTKIFLKISTPRFKTLETSFSKEQLKEYKFSYGENSFIITEVNPEILKLNRIIPKDEYQITLLIQEGK